MIPKIIHYVWLSNDKKPALIRKCIKSWRKKLPDWTIKCWNMTNSPKIDWVDEAIKSRKWALAADYLRLYALYHDGGVYLDSDVYITRNFSELLDSSFFIPIEYNEGKYFGTGSDKKIDATGARIEGMGLIEGLSAQAAIVGSENGNPVLLEMMDYYENNHFILPDGSLNYTYLAPDLMATRLEKYGFKYKNETYELRNPVSNESVGKVYDTSYFASGLISADKNCYAIHMYSSTWKDYGFLENAKYKVKLFIKTFLLNFR